MDKCSTVVDDSTSQCKHATKDVKDLIQYSKLFLELLQGHANSNATKVNDSVDSLTHSLQGEQAKFKAVRTDLQTEN